VGHLQVVTGLADQLYRDAWGVLGGSGGGGMSRSHYNSGAMASGFPRWTTISGFVVPFCFFFLKVVTTLKLGI